MSVTNTESFTTPRDSLPNVFTNVTAREIDFVSRFGQNWDALREEKINLYNMYVEVLHEFNMNDKVLLTLKYISPDEDLSFLTISGGEIVYDAGE